MSNELSNKVIFLTGGGQGIGRECAIAYAREGALVVIADVNTKASEQVLAELSGNGHLAVTCDVSNKQAVELAIKTALEHFGRLDAVHNNAGMSTPAKPLHETTEAEWD